MTQTEKRRDEFWLDAWFDPVADYHAFSSGLCLANDSLVVGDLSGMLKVFSSGKAASQQVKLQGVPTAVKAFYDESKGGASEASVAVACGPHVFVYHRLLPSFKFSLDPAKVGQFEQDVWEKLRSKTLDTARACDVLREQSNLSERSLDLLALENDPQRLDQYVAEELAGGNYKAPIQTCITCMEVVKTRDESDELAPGALVLGTESRKVLILDPTKRAVVKSISLRSVPVFIACTGSLNVEYRIVVACRDKRIYSIKNGDLVRNSIELEAPVCGGVVRTGREVIVACTDRTVHSFHIKGRRNWTIYMPAPVTNLSPFECERLGSSGFLVALRNGEVRLYVEKTLMSTIQVGGQVVTGMQFGRFNREPNALVMLFTSGALGVKMLRRTAKLDASTAPAPGPPAEQDVPLPVPKKTKLYVDQTQREREHAVEMHRAFQHSLCKLRYVTARSYLQLFKNSGLANSQVYTSAKSFISAEDSQERLSMSATVDGLGPTFRLTLRLENVGALAVLGASAALMFDKQAFHVETPLLRLPALLPRVSQAFELSVQNLTPGAESPPVQVVILRCSSVLLTASVEMPVVEALPF